MKYIIGFAFGIGLMLAVAMWDNGHIGWNRHLDIVYVEGDEMPGLGSDNPATADTCYAWVNHQDGHIHVSNTAWMKNTKH